MKCPKHQSTKPGACSSGGCGCSSQALERRPVRLPAGSAVDCPVSTVEPIGPLHGLGSGPVCPVVDASGMVRYGGCAEIGAWRVSEVL